MRKYLNHSSSNSGRAPTEQEKALVKQCGGKNLHRYHTGKNQPETISFSANEEQCAKIQYALECCAGTRWPQWYVRNTEENS